RSIIKTEVIPVGGRIGFVPFLPAGAGIHASDDLLVILTVEHDKLIARDSQSAEPVANRLLPGNWRPLLRPNRREIVGGINAIARWAEELRPIGRAQLAARKEYKCQ